MTTLETIERDGLQGYLHRPDSDPIATLALTHGAGTNCNTALLTAIAEGFADAGLLVLRFDLAFRVRRPKGPPSPARAGEDRAGIIDTVAALRRDYPTAGPLLIGGHSYGGRQASILAAENPDVADGLILTSYPLHPPGKPEKLRIEHLPQVSIPTVVVHGSKDTFATTAEIRSALALIQAPTKLVEFEGAGHDLAVARFPVVEQSVAAAADLFGLFGLRP